MLFAPTLEERDLWVNGFHRVLNIPVHDKSFVPMGVISRDQLNLHEHVMQTEGNNEVSDRPRAGRDATHKKGQSSLDLGHEPPTEEAKEEIVSAHTQASHSTPANGEPTLIKSKTKPGWNNKRTEALAVGKEDSADGGAQRIGQLSWDDTR